MAVVGSLSPLQIIIYYWILVQLRVQITIILLRKTANLAATVTALTPVVSADLILRYQNHSERTLFAVTGIGKQHLILGHSWLQKHNLVMYPYFT